MDFNAIYAWVTTPANFPIIVAGSYVLDKIVKATPWKADDFVVDVVIKGISKLVGRKTDE